MRWWGPVCVVVMTGALALGQDMPNRLVVVVDQGGGTPAEQARVVSVVASIGTAVETYVWSGLGPAPEARFGLGFGDAFEIVRGNTSVLQTVRSRECGHAPSPCGADLVVRSRHALDQYDALANATLAELTRVVAQLAPRSGAAPKTVVFVTTGVPSRADPRRAISALRAALQASQANLLVVDAGTGDRVGPDLKRIADGVGGVALRADDAGLASLRSRLIAPAGPRTAQGVSQRPAGSARQRPPEVEMAAKFAAAFAASAESLVAAEHYVQEIRSRPSSAAMPEDSAAGMTLEKRVIESEVALVPLAGGEMWMLARDIQRVDGRSLEEAQRVPLPTARAASSPEALQQFRAIAALGARFNIGGIWRDLNVPTLALWLLTPALNGRFNFSVGGREPIDDRSAVVVRFRERSAPYLFSAEGRPAPVSGRFWLDHSRGAVVRTELLLASDGAGPASRALVVVSYGFDAPTQMWVPRAMDEQYRSAGTAPFIVAHAAYSNYRKFSGTGRIVK